MGTNTRQSADGGMEFVDDASASVIGKIGGTGGRVMKIAKISMPGTATTTGGALLAWKNPENVAIIIDRLEIDITTKSTGAAAGSFGTAADGVTSSGNLIDAYALGGTEKVVNNLTDGGTAGKTVQKLALNGYVTGTCAATSAGLVSTVYIHYYLV